MVFVMRRIAHPSVGASTALQAPRPQGRHSLPARMGEGGKPADGEVSRADEKLEFPFSFASFGPLVRRCGEFLPPCPEDGDEKSCGPRGQKRGEEETTPFHAGSFPP